MLRENLKDSAEILYNILNQPLEISGTEKTSLCFKRSKITLRNNPSLRFE